MSVENGVEVNSDPIQKLKKLAERREQLATRQARLQIIHEQALAEKARLREEMKQHATTPETVDTDLAQAFEGLTREASTYETDLTEYETVIVNSEKALEAP